MRFINGWNIIIEHMFVLCQHVFLEIKLSIWYHILVGRVAYGCGYNMETMQSHSIPLYKAGIMVGHMAGGSLRDPFYPEIV